MAHTAPSKGLTPMEKIMFGMTAFFLAGMGIYGFVPPGPARVVGMTLYVMAFVYFLFNPLGPRAKRQP